MSRAVPVTPRYGYDGVFLIRVPCQWGADDGGAQVMIIEILSMTLSMMCVVQFYQQTKKELEAHQTLLKFLAIQVVLIIFYTQNVSKSLQDTLLYSSLNLSKSTSPLTVSIVLLQSPDQGKRTHQTNPDDVLSLVGHRRPQHDALFRDGSDVYFPYFCIPPPTVSTPGPGGR
jgi:hypothetical protein